MEARAIHRYIGSSPRKMRLVIDLIRGMSVEKAIEVLHFQPKHASKDAEKVLRSAVSNLMNKDDASKHEPSDSPKYFRQNDTKCGINAKAPLPFSISGRSRTLPDRNKGAPDRRCRWRWKKTARCSLSATVDRRNIS